LVVHEETHVPISFECPHCGKKLKAPDGAVGKSSKCPGCGNAAICPEPIYDAEVVGGTGEEPLGLNSDANLGGDKPYGLIGPPAPAALPAESRRPCPMCGEMILSSAVKCRYCGEVFDDGIRRAKGTKSRRYGPGDEALSGGEIMFGVLCSGIGCIVGVVWMIQGKPKGLKLFGLSIVMSVVWSVVRAFLSQAVKPGGF
jgi:predicted RNA-binding Zn-ribbon protein involved in translation (DUF1610 family)